MASERAFEMVPKWETKCEPASRFTVHVEPVMVKRLCTPGDNKSAAELEAALEEKENIPCSVAPSSGRLRHSILTESGSLGADAGVGVLASQGGHGVDRLDVRLFRRLEAS